MVVVAWITINPAVFRSGVVRDSICGVRSLNADNVTGLPAPAMDAIIRAAKLAGATISSLSCLKAMTRWSGNMVVRFREARRQRIAIARALVADPRILIFDEATSALDYESEALIQQNMAEICQGRTVFIIAHRLSTVRPAHRIYVIERGEILEDGSHDELLKLNGFYARLNKHQEGRFAVV